MRKLLNAGAMKKDGIYNLVYVGNNDAYGKINGKRTILVTATTPKLEYVELHSQFVDSITDDLRSATTTVGDPLIAFKEDEIFEPENESQWYKHSAKITKLSDGIDQGILTREDILGHPVRSSHSPFVAVSGANGKFQGLYTRFGVEGQTNLPYLQAVYAWWDTWENMYADFKQFGVDAKR